MKICILQTGIASSEELMGLCSEIIPEAEVFQIIDDSILKDIKAAGKLTPSVNRRMFAYFLQAQEMGADVILHHCVAASDLVDMVRPFLDIPIVRIDEGMVRSAVDSGRRIAVFATSRTALECSVRFIEKIAAGKNTEVKTVPCLLHNAKDEIRAKAEAAANAGDAIVLAQPSMTAFLPLLEGLDAPVFSCTRSGIEYLKEFMESGAA